VIGNDGPVLPSVWTPEAQGGGFPSLECLNAMWTLKHWSNWANRNRFKNHWVNCVYACELTKACGRLWGAGVGKGYERFQEACISVLEGLCEQLKDVGTIPWEGDCHKMATSVCGRFEEKDIHDAEAGARCAQAGQDCHTCCCFYHRPYKSAGRG